MFELKKFIALIGLENRLMQLFYDKAEAAGLNPTFDVYQVLAGNETPSEEEIAIMKQIYEFNIRGTFYEEQYSRADIDFREKTAERNRKRSNDQNDNTFLNN